MSDTNQVVPVQPVAEKRYKNSFLHFFWHPHQGMWNGRSAKVAKRFKLLTALIAVDSYIMYLRAMQDRVKKVGIGSLFATPKTARRVIILDAGLHRTAKQIKAIVPWMRDRARNLTVFGFEAHPDYFRDASVATAQFDRVNLMNVALVGPDYGEPTIHLHLTVGSGVGDTIMRARGGHRTIEVRARRLSEILTEKSINPSKCCIILRMNIEGAELGVLKDLEAAKMLDQVDGFFGSWDDLYKMDPEMDLEFRKFKRKNKIRTVPFNDRDLKRSRVFAYRKKVIRYALNTALLYADKRKKDVRTEISDADAAPKRAAPPPRKAGPATPATAKPAPAKPAAKP